MNIKKSSIILLIGAVVMGLSAITVSADEDVIPDAVIEHDASNGERDFDEVHEGDSINDELIIAPNQNEESLIIAPAPDHNSDTIGTLSGTEANNKVISAEMPIVGIIGVIAALAIAAVVIYKKK